ncbi:MAG: hypothetical protein PUC86_04760 [Solobacterium sp.]|nr:hypothetical protein [Erysipelotrichaceae bacterium]MDD5842870.1 hypothetical protein [Solobacterium sp.]MDD6497758.1 hypothetical protein [Solobacterium sp.]MDD6834699.1 hypothetical protein [Solobacterium sp.]MDD6885140.1 hypothetical protein [Solobacterium sp.]
MDKNTINKLAYDLTYQRYLLNKDKANYLFNDLSVGDYVVLHTVLCFEDKAYLEKLGEKLNLSISKMSNVATNLKNRGLVIWSHDGDGSEGTYLTVTETGLKLMDKQEDKLKNYYERVINRFGLKNTVDLIGKMTALETIMEEEMENE